MTRTCLTDTGELAGARGGGGRAVGHDARRGDGDGGALRLLPSARMHFGVGVVENHCLGCRGLKIFVNIVEIDKL